MIFVTIGSAMPFDRLIKAADEVAPSFPEEKFHAQIGDGAYRPVNMAFDRMLSARKFAQMVSEASVIVAHAGMGSLLTAAETAKPIVIMPRRLALGEHLTDHQMATARKFGIRPGVYLATVESELGPAISRALTQGPQAALATSAPEPFLRRIRDFIDPTPRVPLDHAR